MIKWFIGVWVAAAIIPTPDDPIPGPGPVICEAPELSQIYVELWLPLFGYQPDPWNAKTDPWVLRIQAEGGTWALDPYVECEAPVEIFIRPHQEVGIPPPDVPTEKVISTTLIEGGPDFVLFGFARDDFPRESWFYHQTDAWCASYSTRTVAAKVEVNGGVPPLGNSTTWVVLPEIDCQ